MNTAAVTLRVLEQGTLIQYQVFRKAKEGHVNTSARALIT